MREGTTLITDLRTILTGSIADCRLTPAVIVFAGLPGRADCVNESVSALTRKYPGLDAAAADLEYPDAKALDDAILEHCSSPQGRLSGCWPHP